MDIKQTITKAQLEEITKIGYATYWRPEINLEKKWISISPWSRESERRKTRAILAAVGIEVRETGEYLQEAIKDLEGDVATATDAKQLEKKGIAYIVLESVRAQLDRAMEQRNKALRELAEVREERDKLRDQAAIKYTPDGIKATAGEVITHAWTERAAIMEYDGGLSRHDADRAAWVLLIGDIE